MALLAGLDGVPGALERSRSEALVGATSMVAVDPDSLPEAVRERVAELAVALVPLVTHRELRGAGGAPLPPRHRRGTRAVGRTCQAPDRRRPAGEVARGWVQAWLDEALPSVPGQLPQLVLVGPTRGVSPIEAEPTGPGTARAQRSLDGWMTQHHVDAKFGADIKYDPTSGELLIGVYLGENAPAEAPAGIWARAFARDWTPLAMAPIRRAEATGDRPSAHAQLAVPPGMTLDDVIIDLTLTPSRAPDSSPLGLIRSACGSGARAADRERWGDFHGAAGAWARCAEFWERAGDVDRQALALGYAARDEPHHHPAVEYRDRAQEVAQESRWARWFVERDLDLVKLFLAAEYFAYQARPTSTKGAQK